MGCRVMGRAAEEADSASRAAECALLTEVIEGLSQPQKQLPPKLFYDARGSRLFERICEQPEYYIPNTESALLRGNAEALRRFAGPRCLVLEPGAGTGVKTPLLLGALEDPVAYVPIDIAPQALLRCEQHIRALFPRLRVLPVCADFTHRFAVARMEGAQWRRRLVFCPGSTIGNFDRGQAIHQLAEWRRLAGSRGGLVIGVDLCKPRARLEAAYDDAAGVTAQFNLNLLQRLNREFGADFDLEGFAHRAEYNVEAGRVEMHLTSRRAQQVNIGGRSIRFARGETIRTENSYKYTPADFAEVALSAGWARRELWIDEHDLFSVQCFEAIA